MKGFDIIIMEMHEIKRDFAKKFQSVKKYTAEEFFEFVKGTDEFERYELFDGRIYMMAAPAFGHQNIAGNIYRVLGNYLQGKKCKPGIAPVDVVLFAKDKDRNKAQNVFQPDVFVVCDEKKKSQHGINGAPDFVVEVVSPSNPEHDYIDKLNVYMKYGVKEYWIVNPMKKKIFVYIKGKKTVEIYDYTFDDKIKVSIFEDDFYIDFKELQI